MNVRLKTLPAVIAVLFCFIACRQSPPKVIDLAQFSKDFDVAHYYKDKLKQSDNNQDEDPAQSDPEKVLEMLKQHFYQKQEFYYFKDNNDEPDDKRFIDAKEYSTPENISELFGYYYSMLSWSPSDTIGIFGNIPFCKIDILSNKNNQFVALYAENSYPETGDFSRLVTLSDQEFGKGKYVEGDFSDERALQWENDGLIYQLMIPENMNPDGTKVMPDNVDSTTTSRKSLSRPEVNFFIFDKSFYNDLKSIRLGSWIDII